MGVVMLAVHEGLGERVVLKVLRREIAGDPENLERLRREARTMARLRSEHVARIMDVGVLEDQTPYLVLEYVRGESLRQLLQRRGALPAREAVGLALQVCEGLAEAHVNQVIHRDLKPSNLILSERPDGSPLVKILDFGIAKTSAPTVQTLTETQSMLGSPLYMAPEQIRSARDVGASADVWALGVTLYELLTNKLPFQAFTTGAVIAAVLADDPVPPRQHVPDLPAGLEATVLRCLERAPERRFQDVGALAEALVPWGPDDAQAIAARTQRTLQRTPRQVTLPLVPPVPSTPERPSGTLQLTASRTATQLRTAPSSPPPPPGPRRGLWLGGLGAGLLALAALLRPQSPAAPLPASKLLPAAASPAPGPPAASPPAALVSSPSPPASAPVAPALASTPAPALPPSAAPVASARPRPRLPPPAPHTPAPTGGMADFGPRH